MVVGIDRQPDFTEGVGRPFHHEQLVVFPTPFRRAILFAMEVIEYPPGNNRGVLNIDIFTVCSQRFTPRTNNSGENESFRFRADALFY